MNKLLKLTTIAFFSIATSLSAHAQSKIGPVTIVHSEDLELCKAMVSSHDITSDRPYYQDKGIKLVSWNIKIPEGGNPIKGRGWACEEDIVIGPESDRISKSEFDIDNNGIKDEVYGYHLRVHSDYSDTYFFGFEKSMSEVFDAWNKKIMSWPKLFPSPEDIATATTSLLPSPSPESQSRIDPMDTLLKYTHSRFPDMILKTSDGSPSAYASDPYQGKSGDLCLSKYKENGKEYCLRSQYLRAQPFTWKGNTYFIMREMGAQSIQAVVKIKYPSEMQEVCIFKFKKSCLLGGFSEDACEIRHR